MRLGGPLATGFAASLIKIEDVGGHFIRSLMRRRARERELPQRRGVSGRAGRQDGGRAGSGRRRRRALPEYPERRPPIAERRRADAHLPAFGARRGGRPGAC